jgi:hypothetical protein
MPRRTLKKRRHTRSTGTYFGARHCLCGGLGAGSHFWIPSFKASSGSKPCSTIPPKN